jgi:hypothetical protein
MEDINKTLDEAIRSKDIKAIRDVLTTSMVQDPGFSKGVFEERLKRCHIADISDSELFVSFEGSAINRDPNAWTKDYYAEQRTEFRYNFSRERLDHLKKVGRKLYPSGIPAVSFSKEEAKKKYGDRGTFQEGQGFQREGGDFPKWLILVGIGAAALVFLWILFGRK